MSPNTFNLQEEARRNFDFFLEQQEEGNRDMPTPFVFTVERGQCKTQPLIVYTRLITCRHENPEWFSPHK